MYHSQIGVGEALYSSGAAQQIYVQYMVSLDGTQEDPGTLLVQGTTPFWGSHPGREQITIKLFSLPRSECRLPQDIGVSPICPGKSFTHFYFIGVVPWGQAFRQSIWQPIAGFLHG